jgi:hypothetical protein
VERHVTSTSLSHHQLTLLAQAAEVMTQLRKTAFSRGTPKPVERIEVVPGVAALVVTGNKGLDTGYYVLEVAATTPEPSDGGHPPSRTPGG